MAKEDDEEEEEGRGEEGGRAEGEEQPDDNNKLVADERRSDRREEENVDEKQGGKRRRRRVENDDERVAEEGNGRREDDDSLRKGQGGYRQRRRKHVEVEEQAEDDDEEGEEDGEGRKRAGRRRRQKRNGKSKEGEEEEDEDTVSLVDKDDGNDNVEEGEVDEDEANADLSLHIVAKAEQRRKKKSSSSAMGLGTKEVEVFRIGTAGADSEAQNVTVMYDVFVNDGRKETTPLTGRNLSIEEGEFIELGESTPQRNEPLEEGELQEEDVNLNPLLATELPEAGDDGNLVDDERAKRKKKKKEKKEKKEKKKHKKGGEGRDNINDHSKSNRGNADKESLVIEIKDGDAEESMVMRKLLRGPRYFDPPEELGQSCFNCGKVGHLASKCPEGPRLKPCYVCGGFGHEGRECPQKTECYVCGKVGHIAKTCPNKGSGTMRVSARGGSDDICLLCGLDGHEASSCYYSYDTQDLAQIQCYICKGFGHLACVVVVDTSPLPVSCYDCGEMGHTGAGCARPRRNDRDRDRGGTASVCFKCGEEGHYARGCSKRNLPWPAPWPPDGIPGGGLSRLEDRYTPRSSRIPRWMDLQQREPRWPPVRRQPAGGANRWATGSRVASESPVARGRGRAADVSLDVGEDTDSYMGPIENFAGASPKDGYRKRRRKDWTSTSAR